MSLTKKALKKKLSTYFYYTNEMLKKISSLLENN